MKPTKVLMMMSFVMVFLVSLTITNVALASPETYFYVDPSYMQGTPTGKFQVTINVADAPPSYAWEITLYWNPDRLELLSVEEGDFLHRWEPNPFPPPDYYKKYPTAIAYTPLGEANAVGKVLAVCALMTQLPMSDWASGNGYLCKLTFLAQARGGASLDLFNTRLYDHMEGNWPAATVYPDVDGLIDCSSFFFAALDGWKLKVNGKAGVSEEGGLKTNVGEPNLFEANIKNSGTFDAYVQVFFEIRDGAGYWLATIPSGIVLLPSGASTTLSVTWTANGVGSYYIAAYSFYGELTPKIQDGFSRTVRLRAV